MARKISNIVQRNLYRMGAFFVIILLTVMLQLHASSLAVSGRSARSASGARSQELSTYDDHDNDDHDDDDDDGGIARTLTVKCTNPLTFGTVMRNTTTTVLPIAGNAARFEVTGKKGCAVGFTFSTTDLKQVDLSSGRGVIPFSLTPSLCSYSFNGGVTWTSFTPITIMNSITLPSVANETKGTIYIRCGGKMISSIDQHRGQYAAAITLTAVYK